MRTFVALPLPGDVQDALVRVQSGIRTGRPVARENLHLTLAFLDAQPANVLEELDGHLAAIRVPPFPLTLCGLGSFGRDSPRTLYAECAEQPALVGLQRRVRASARLAGINLARARFRPHVTLTRFARSEAASARAAVTWAMRGQASFPAVSFEVTAFALYMSTLRPHGPSYEALANYSLRFEGMELPGGWAPEDH